MTATITNLQLPVPSQATPEQMLTAGAKRIMGVVKNKGITSVEVFELVIRWGQYVDQAAHPESRCGICSHPVRWNSFDNCYVHIDSEHRHCSTHAGRTANVQS